MLGADRSIMNPKAGSHGLSWMPKSSAKSQEEPGGNSGIPDEPLNFFRSVPWVSKDMACTNAISVAVTPYGRSRLTSAEKGFIAWTASKMPEEDRTYPCCLVETARIRASTLLAFQANRLTCFHVPLAQILFAHQTNVPKDGGRSDCASLMALEISDLAEFIFVHLHQIQIWI